MTGPLETIFALLGSTSAFVAIILVCGFSLSLARLNYRQRDVLDQISSARERYLIRGSAFVLFAALVLVITLGSLVRALQVNIGDAAGIILLTLPVAANEYSLRSRRAFRQRTWVFVLYVTIGSLLLTLSLGIRILTGEWTSLIGVLSNGAFIGVQLIVFAIGWGVTSPAGKYQIELLLDNDQIITGLWIARAGDEFLLEVEDTVVAVSATKVVRRTFRSVYTEPEPRKQKQT